MVQGIKWNARHAEEWVVLSVRLKTLSVTDQERGLIKEACSNSSRVGHKTSGRVIVETKSRTNLSCKLRLASSPVYEGLLSESRVGTVDDALSTRSNSVELLNTRTLEVGIRSGTSSGIGTGEVVVQRVSSRSTRSTDGALVLDRLDCDCFALLG